MVCITEVAPDSLAHRAALRCGDCLEKINGNPIRDVLDYRFYLTDTTVHLELVRDGNPFSVLLHKGEYEDIGLSFQTPLMDKKHACANRCVFCFIDQLPQGMRDSLYFKDDDDRLSFLHGNYVTLTNLHDADIERILKMHISPINVSVHTTNPTLRVRMMKNRRAGEVLSYLRTMADAGIALCTQIVLCKGWNDGVELERSMRDLETYAPSLRSCSVVPVGLTKHRQGLEPLQDFSAADCAEVIDTVNRFGEDCLKRHGTRLFYCSDEWYLRAGRPLPKEDYYEDYSQLENGVGMLTSLCAEFDLELQYLQQALERFTPPRTLSVATGRAAYESIQALCQRLVSMVDGLRIHVYPIENHFFGESVTVAGLLTGQDVIAQLRGRPLGEELLFPAVMLKADEDIFLDDLTPSDLSEALGGIPTRAVENDGAKLLYALLGVEQDWISSMCGASARTSAWKG